MVGETLRPNRLEGAGSDMESDEGFCDAQILEPVEQGLIKMQAGGGRGHRAGIAGINRLIAVAVGRGRRAGDIRRQRDLAVLFQ